MYQWTCDHLHQSYQRLLVLDQQVMSRLAQQHNSVNLGQGFPDDEGPESMKKIVGDATLEYSNQYPPMLGVPELRQAVARHSAAFDGLDVNWQTECLVSVGATEGLCAAFMGLLNPGDEVRCLLYLVDFFLPAV